MSAAWQRNFTPHNGRQVLRHGLSTAVFCCVIALALAAAGRGRWSSQLVYSLAIGTISWLIIDIGRLLLSTDPEKPWPGGMRSVLLVTAGALGGFFGGSAIGDAWSGAPRPDFWRLSPEHFGSTLVITALACVAVCYYFYSNGKSRYLEGAIALAQRDAADARLRLLETQLEPHMLFNTLANLRALIATDPVRAIAMLDRLNAYLRVTLSGSRALSHPLAAEFERLADYLGLMAVRMGERLRYTLDLPPELGAVQVPPLLLQPLVENSIRHGLEPKVEGGEIRVEARREGDRLCIAVRDTGVGSELQAGASAGGFGLDQVRERLATVHGSAASLALAAPAAGGFCATITLPLKTS